MKDWNEVLAHRAEIPNRNYFKSIVLPEQGRRDAKRELGDALKSKIVEGRKKVFWME